MGISNFPQETFYGESVYVISQVTNDKPIEIELAERLKNESWVDVVSPEVYAFCIVKDNPVVVRGVEASSFLEIEGARLVEGEITEEFVLVGEALSNRLGLRNGDQLVITGSVGPKITERQLTGIYRSDSPSNDELLVPLTHGWMISPLGKGHVVSIRVRTDDYDRLRTYLNATGYPMVLGDGKRSVVLNSNVIFDARVATLIFQNPELGGQRGIAHTSAFVQQAGNSVSLVVMAFIVLNSSLILLGIIAVLSKALIEKKKDIGILSAIGATRGQVSTMLFKDLAKISLVSVLVGLGVGFLVAGLVGSTGILLLFGHAVQPASGVEIVLGMFILGLSLTIILGLLIHELVSREKPITLIRRIESSTIKEKRLEEVLSE
ncbi:MAG: FtsX-like permease family protein [Thermoplasmata archaeon]|nr:FtsX-like permease family protein [Thermoplasmata archaeon]